MMGIISVRRIPRGCVLQHINKWGLGNAYKYKKQVRAPPEKWGGGGLRNGQIEIGVLRKGIMKREGISN